MFEFEHFYCLKLLYLYFCATVYPVIFDVYNCSGIRLDPRKILSPKFYIRTPNICKICDTKILTKSLIKFTHKLQVSKENMHIAENFIILNCVRIRRKKLGRRIPAF